MRVTKTQNKDFGIVITLAFIVIGICTREWLWIYIAAGFGIVTAIIPVLLKPFTWGWYLLACWLEKMTTGILLSVVYYLVVTPVGLLRRLSHKQSEGITSTFHQSDHKYMTRDFDKQFIDY